MGYRSATQIILVILSIIVIFTYLKPEFANLRILQDEVAEYKDAVDRASQFNATLEGLLQTASSFPQKDMQALERYLPTELDTVAVARDIETIARRSGMRLAGITIDSQAESSDVQSVSGADGVSLITAAQMALKPHTFTSTVSGTYESFKDFLVALEYNAYPLEVISLGFTSGEDEDDTTFDYTVTVETYSLNPNGN